MSEPTKGPWLFDGSDLRGNPDQHPMRWRTEYSIRLPNGRILATLQEDTRPADGEAMAAAPLMWAALRAILPYAESRLEDIEERAREVAEDPNIGPEANAAARKAREARQAAVAALAAAEGRS